MFDIKRARNNFNGFRATMTEAEFDGFMYVLEAAASQYEEAGIKQAEYCGDLIRTLTELAYFDPEKREVHIMLNYGELAVFTRALYDVMLPGFRPDSDRSFAKRLEKPETKIWKNRQPTEK